MNAQTISQATQGNLIEFFGEKLAQYGNCELAARLTLVKFGATKSQIEEMLGWDVFSA